MSPMPSDLRCTKGIEVLRVEVKGTQTEGEEILLTPNEVAFVTSHRDTMELSERRGAALESPALQSWEGMNYEPSASGTA